jgi:hypothetical protein
MVCHCMCTCDDSVITHIKPIICHNKLYNCAPSIHAKITIYCDQIKRILQHDDTICEYSLIRTTCSLIIFTDINIYWHQYLLTSIFTDINIHWHQYSPTPIFKYNNTYCFIPPQDNDVWTILFMNHKSFLISHLIPFHWSLSSSPQDLSYYHSNYS